MLLNGPMALRLAEGSPNAYFDPRNRGLFWGMLAFLE